MKKPVHIYRIWLSSGEQLESVRIYGALEWNLSGVTANFVTGEDGAGKTIVLSKYHIVKAELLKVEE